MVIKLQIKRFFLAIYSCYIIDIDECSGVNFCQQNCANTVGSFVCSCEEGFTLDVNGSCIGKSFGRSCEH